MELEHRVIKLEMRVDGHANQLKELEGSQDALKSALQSIQNTLLQIKWLGIGVTVVLVTQEMGLKDALKMVLGFF